MTSFWGLLRAARATLRGQLLIWLVPPLLLVAVVSAYSAYTFALRFATEAYDIALFDSARSLAQQIIVTADGRASITLPRAAQELLVSDPYDLVFYDVIAADGASVAGNALIPAPPVPPSRRKLASFYDAKLYGQPVRVAAYGLFGPGEKPAATALYAETLEKRSRLSRHLLFTLLVPLLIVSAVATALVWFGIRRVLGPLNQLAPAFAERGWGDLRVVEHGQVPDEVRPLMDSLDNLMTRLAATHTAQQRFISEAAHQLRTPLAGLTAQVERALLSSDINGIREALGQLESSARRVARLVNQLLSLARAEPGSDPEHDLKPIDVSRVVQETCRDWVREALEKDVDLGYSGETGPLVIVGHEFLLAEMLNNLVDNALRYGARAGGSITVRLTAHPQPEIAVEDDGPGIPDAERTRIFERFHRVPGTAAGGCGLGLAIVREIARLHGAEVTAEPRPSGPGVIFRVVFTKRVGAIMPPDSERL